jgi:outer membrane lipoprotein SlyB
MPPTSVKKGNLIVDDKKDKDHTALKGAVLTGLAAAGGATAGLIVAGPVGALAAGIAAGKWVGDPAYEALKKKQGK